MPSDEVQAACDKALNACDRALKDKDKVIKAQEDSLKDATDRVAELTARDNGIIESKGFWFVLGALISALVWVVVIK